MDVFAEPLMVGLKKGLDAGTQRQRVIAHNIANLNTPFFKKSAVEFEGLLKKALGRVPVEMVTTHPGHMGGRPVLADLRPEVKVNKATSMRLDGNNVDIDEEMTSLAANTIQYQAVARVLGERYALLGMVITGGRR